MTTVNPTGKLMPCCVWKGQVSNPISEYDNWINSEYMQSIRESLHTGKKISPCQTCWDCESSGIKSFRNILEETFPDEVAKYKISKEWLVESPSVALDLKLGNLCNLKCVMCFPNASSQLMTEYKEHKIKFESLSKYELRAELEIDFRWPLSSEFVEFMNRFSDTVRWIKFTGGEPTMNPYIFEILDQIKKPELVTVHLITNATKVNNKLLNLLSKFQQVIMIVSLEGIGLHNDQVRWLSHWDEVEQNVLKLQGLGKNSHSYHMNILHVMQCFSVNTLIPLLDWCENNKLKLCVNPLMIPDYLSISSVLPAVIDRFCNELKKLKLVINNDVPEMVLNLIETTYHYDPTLRQQQIEYLTMLDDIRGSNLINLMNEYEPTTI
jgi:hypothetical protein